MICKFGTILQLTVYNVQLTIMEESPVEAHGRVTEKNVIKTHVRASLQEK